MEQKEIKVCIFEDNKFLRESLSFIIDNRDIIPKIEQVNPFTYYDGTLSDKIADYRLTQVGIDRMARFVAAIKDNGFKYTNAFIGNLMEKNVSG